MSHRVTFPKPLRGLLSSGWEPMVYGRKRTDCCQRLGGDNQNAFLIHDCSFILLTKLKRLKLNIVSAQL